MTDTKYMKNNCYLTFFFNKV